jgi:hypothetical protein
MGLRTTMVAALCWTAIVSTECARAQDAQSAKAFLAEIYQKYQHGGHGIDLTQSGAGKYFHSSLVELLRQDAEADGAENVPAVDYDPICGCQDWEGIFGLKIEVRAESAGKVEATVSFRTLPPKYNGKRFLKKLIFSLVTERGQWRIYDVVDESDHLQVVSMRKLLMDDLEAKRKG